MFNKIAISGIISVFCAVPSAFADTCENYQCNYYSNGQCMDFTCDGDYQAPTYYNSSSRYYDDRYYNYNYNVNDRYTYDTRYRGTYLFDDGRNFDTSYYYGNTYRANSSRYYNADDDARYYREVTDRYNGRRLYDNSYYDLTSGTRAGSYYGYPIRAGNYYDNRYRY